MQIKLSESCGNCANFSDTDFCQKFNFDTTANSEPHRPASISWLPPTDKTCFVSADELDATGRLTSLINLFFQQT